MINQYSIVPLIPQYKLFRSFNYPKMLPLNLTVSLTYRCNSRCKTCNVWNKEVDEFSVEEFYKTFESIGTTPYWITFSGGEPFLRDDISEICKAAYENIKPGIINIPTNGIKHDVIQDKIEEIVQFCKKTQIIVNLSIDGIEEKHDAIRNVKGNFKKALKTYNALKELDYPNFNLGIHTVISKYNVHDVANIYTYFLEKGVDSYITEIAEERVELGTKGYGITPSPSDYSKTIDELMNQFEKQNSSGISKVTKAFRLTYYSHVKKVLERNMQIIPCYAGFASAHIAPHGDVWPCCIEAKPIGNLRDVEYNFKKIWFGKEATFERSKIKDQECFCTLANAHYTNMLCNIGTLIGVGLKVIF